jgi:hypothetical protein
MIILLTAIILILIPFAAVGITTICFSQFFRRRKKKHLPNGYSDTNTYTNVLACYSKAEKKEIVDLLSNNKEKKDDRSSISV